MLRAVGPAVVLLLALGAGEALACRVPFIATFDNQTVDGTMSARSGRRCSISLRRSLGPMHGVVVVDRPSNGTASISGQRVIYVSKPGFVGRDAFTYVRHGHNRWGQPIVRTVRVAVTVRP